MPGFDLSEVMKDVSRLDTGRDQITYIPHENLVPDKANGYSMTGLEDLARSIEIAGLQQPLRVRPIEGEAGRYRIISGHRRHAAIGLLIKQGCASFDEGVPCIVDSGAASEALRELQLLLGNADNRKMTSADEAQQAERISDCIRKLEDEGYQFPGRHRDWVSKLSGMSRTKLARISTIKNNLLPELYRDYYRKGKMNESVAYAMAQQPQIIQREIVAMRQKWDKSIEHMYESYVTDFCSAKKRFAALKCKISNGAPCINQDRLLDKVCDGSWGYKPCGHTGNSCCANCSEYLNCRDRCPLMDEKAKKERAAKREASKDQKAREKSQKETAIRDVEQVWARFSQALDAKGLTDKQFRAQLKTGETLYNEFETYLDKDKTAALLDYSCTDTKPNDPLPFYYSFHADDYRKLVRIADALDVSLDYLFLRDDTPKAAPVSKPDTAPEWQTGQPEKEGPYWCEIQCGQEVKRQPARWSDEFGWKFYNINATFQAPVLRWWPLPEEDSVGDELPGGKEE